MIQGERNPANHSGRTIWRSSSSANGQPAGGSTRSGVRPGMACSLVWLGWCSRGIDRSRPHVYGCAGARKTASLDPSSTTSPAYMTTIAELPASAAGQSIRLRWRMQSNGSVVKTLKRSNLWEVQTPQVLIYISPPAPEFSPDCSGQGG